MTPTPVPLPAPEDEKLTPPDRDEVELMQRAFASASAPPEGLTDVQRAVLNAVTEAMTGIAIDVATLPSLGPEEFAEALRFRGRGFRARMVQVMLLSELVLVPLPPEVTDRVEDYAACLGVDDEMLHVVRSVARGSLGLALIDFERSGYFQDMLERPGEHLHTSGALQDAWQASCDDPDLYAQWAALEGCPEGSLGLGVWRFYRARGFTFPGRANSAPPNLAQHDWVHVLADYGSTVECEIEVFGLISRANDDPKGFTLLAMVIGLFETGYLARAADGFFQYDRGHLSRDVDRMAVRLADALYRGAKLAWHLDDHGRSDETDLLAIDWFAHADRPLDDVRADFGLLARSERALVAGSVTPWEPGGISPFQFEQGRAAAAALGRRYESFGASPD